MQIVALAVLILILLPVISVTDDLQAALKSSRDRLLSAAGTMRVQPRTPSFPPLPPCRCPPSLAYPSAFVRMASPAIFPPGFRQSRTGTHPEPPPAGCLIAHRCLFLINGFLFLCPPCSPRRKGCV